MNNPTEEEFYSIIDDFVFERTDNPKDANFYPIVCKKCGGHVLMVECKGDTIAFGGNWCCRKALRRKRKKLHLQQGTELTAKLELFP